MMQIVAVQTVSEAKGGDVRPQPSVSFVLGSYQRRRFVEDALAFLDRFEAVRRCWA
jgi:hypothetical protein